MYEQIRFEIRDGIIEIVNRYPTAQGGARGKKRKKTPEEMERANQRNREKTLQRLILANFEAGDFHLVLSYHKDNNPGDYEAAKAELQKFLAGVRREYKKAGYGFQYIGVTERGKRAATLHHHLILKNIEGLTVKAVRKHWKGYCTWHDLYEDGDFANLAAYIIKKETKEEAKGASYTRSRNLKVPEGEKTIVHKKEWPTEPEAEKGWYVVKESVYNCVNPVTGRPYQSYLMRREKWSKSMSTSTSPPEAACPRTTGDTGMSLSTSRRQRSRRQERASEKRKRRRRRGLRCTRSWRRSGT